MRSPTPLPTSFGVPWRQLPRWAGLLARNLGPRRPGTWVVSWPCWLLVLATARVRGVVAGYGTAMVILEGPAVPVRRQVAAVGLGAVGATVLGVLSFPLLWAAYHAALATGLSRPVAEPLCTAVLAAVFIVEARGMIRSSRNAATARRVRLIHEPGAEYWEASCLVAAPDGISAGRLCRNLLQWTDAHQVGLVASAASPHLAQRYSRLGFSPVEGYPEQILRRPPAECRPAPARSGRRRLPQRTC